MPLMNPFGSSDTDPRKTARLRLLRDRYARGEFRAPTDVEKHLAFARWLVQHAKLNEDPRNPPSSG